MTPAVIDATSILVALIPVVLGGGAVTLVQTLRKAGPEASSIAVANVVRVNEEQRKELDRNQKTIEGQRVEIVELQKQIAAARVEIGELTASLAAARRS